MADAKDIYAFTVKKADGQPQALAQAHGALYAELRRFYEVDPLECPRCKDEEVIQRILKHWGLCTPRQRAAQRRRSRRRTPLPQSVSPSSACRKRQRSCACRCWAFKNVPFDHTTDCSRRIRIKH